MKRLFLILSILLLSATTSTAGGLFSGCMGSGFATNVSYRAETYAYQSRVLADGGVVVDIALVDEAYQLLANHSLSPVCWVDANFGVKKDGSEYVTKLYDLSSNEHDPTQDGATKYPQWTAAQQNGLAGIYFDGSNDELGFGNMLGTSASFTFTTSVSVADVTANQLLWANYDGSNAYSLWFLEYRGASNGDLSMRISNQAASQGTSAYTTSGSQISNNVWHVRSDKYATGAYNNMAIYVNGVSKSLSYNSTTADTNAVSGLESRLAFNSSFHGYIGSFIMFGSALSDANRGYVETFINTKYAIY